MKAALGVEIQYAVNAQHESQKLDTQDGELKDYPSDRYSDLQNEAFVQSG